jgi:hypothetical protein
MLKSSAIITLIAAMIAAGVASAQGPPTDKELRAAFDRRNLRRRKTWDGVKGICSAIGIGQMTTPIQRQNAGMIAERRPASV